MCFKVRRVSSEIFDSNNTFLENNTANLILDSCGNSEASSEGSSNWYSSNYYASKYGGTVVRR